MFVRKVFGIVAAQLMLTTVITGISLTSSSMRYMMLTTTWPLYLALFGAFATSLVLTFSREIARTVPKNYALLTVFTVCQAYSVATLCQFSDPEIVFMALVGTVGIVMGLTVYAMTTKRDFTMMGASLFLLMSGMLVLSIFNWFFRVPFIMTLLTAGGCVLEGFYLVYDVQLICGGKRGEFSIDDYISASMNLYIDIIRIFIKLLDLLNKL